MTNAETRKSQSYVPLLVLAIGLAALYFLWSILILFILAAFLAFIIHPLVSLLDRKLPHAFSIVLVYLLVIVGLIIIVGLLAPVISFQFAEFVKSIPSYFKQAQGLIADLQQRYAVLPAAWRPIVDRTLIQLEAWVIRVSQQSLPAVFSLLTNLVTLIIVPLLSFYMLLGYKGYKEMLLTVTPRQHRETINDLLASTSQTLWNYVRGELILTTTVGVVTGFGLYAVGMPYAAVFGVLAGILEAVPNVGPVTTSVIVISIGLMIHPILGLKAGIVTIGVQLLEGAFLAPVVMGRAVGLNPITVIFAIFVGAKAAGVLGAIVAIPIAVLTKIVILYFYASDDGLPEQEKISRPPSRRRPRTRQPKE